MRIPEGTLVPFEGRGRRGRGIVPLDQRNQRNGRQMRLGKITFPPANFLLIREEEREKVLQELAPVVICGIGRQRLRGQRPEVQINFEQPFTLHYF